MDERKVVSHSENGLEVAEEPINEVATPKRLRAEGQTPRKSVRLDSDSMAVSNHENLEDPSPRRSTPSRREDVERQISRKSLRLVVTTPSKHENADVLTPYKGQNSEVLTPSKRQKSDVLTPSKGQNSEVLTLSKRQKSDDVLTPSKSQNSDVLTPSKGQNSDLTPSKLQNSQAQPPTKRGYPDVTTPLKSPGSPGPTPRKNLRLEGVSQPKPLFPVSTDSTSIVGNSENKSEDEHDDTEDSKQQVDEEVPEGQDEEDSKCSEVYDEEYVVEKIVDMSTESDGKRRFFVKWKGWSNEDNTWEPEEHLTNCKEKLLAFEEKRQKEQERENLKKAKLATYSPSVKDVEAFYMKLRQSGNSVAQILLECKAVLKTRKLSTPPQIRRHFLHEQLKSAIERQRNETGLWAQALTDASTDAGEVGIKVINTVDLAGPPEGFTFITSSIPGPGVVIPSDPVLSCDCVTCAESDSCCPDKGVLGDPTGFPYDKHGRLKVKGDLPLYECNKNCACGPGCLNRVVQNGRKIPLTIFRTVNKGWGVKGDVDIKRGQFVTEYIGEIVTEEEAEKRGSEYDAEGVTYLLDLDYGTEDNSHVIDAAKYGNVSHFINHSCDPNLAVRIAYINCQDISIPHVAFFARRYIRHGEELSFNYSPMRRDDDETGATAVTQGTPNVRRMAAAAADGSGPSDGGEVAATTPKITPKKERKKTPCFCGAKNCLGVIPL